MDNRVILIGGGGFGREVLSWASDAAKANGFPRITSLIDDNPSALSEFSYDIEYIGSIVDFEPKDGDVFVLGVASPDFKKKIAEKFSLNVNNFLTLVHPSAVVSSTARIGQGVIICPFALVSADTRIGDFVTINAMSSVGHDSVIGSFSTLSGHVDVTGQVKVGEEVFFGTGAKIVPRIRIGSKSKIGAGCTVMRSVQESSTYYAMPAKKLF